MKKALLCLGLLLAGLTVGFAQEKSAAGVWYGSISLPSIQMDIRVTLQQEDGNWTGNIDIPSQGAKALPLSDILSQDATIIFAIPRVDGYPTFSGKVSEDGRIIEGEFRQGSGKFPFRLTRAPRSR